MPWASREKQREYRIKKKLEGCCSRCQKILTDKKRGKCKTCISAEKTRGDKLNEQGLCRVCAKRPLATTTRCRECADRFNAVQSTKRATKRAKAGVA